MTIAVIASLFYSLVIFAFLFAALLQNISEGAWMSVFFTAFFMVTVFYQAYLFLKSARELKTAPRLVFSPGEVIAVVTGAVATAFLIRTFSLSSVAASAVIGIIGTMIAPGYSFSIFCGSFVGMSASTVLSYPGIFLASLISGLVFIFGRYGYHGMGGKLGVTAFIGVWATVGMSAKISTDSAEIFLNMITVNPALVSVIIGLCGAGSILTYILNQRWRIHIVISSGIVGISSVILLALTGAENGSLISAAIYCASFAGMCNRDRLRGPGMFVLVGILSGVLYLITLSVFYQFGGKLGTIAFLAALSTKTIGEWLWPVAHEFFCED